MILFLVQPASLAEVHIQPYDYLRLATVTDYPERDTPNLATSFGAYTELVLLIP